MNFRCLVSQKTRVNFRCLVSQKTRVNFRCLVSQKTRVNFRCLVSQKTRVNFRCLVSQKTRVNFRCLGSRKTRVYFPCLVCGMLSDTRGAILMENTENKGVRDTRSLISLNVAHLSKKSANRGTSVRYIQKSHLFGKISASVSVSRANTIGRKKKRVGQKVKNNLLSHPLSNERNRHYLLKQVVSLFHNLLK